jgi:hypothetical protein
MIGTILNMLDMDSFHNISENIEIAKGKYKAPTTIREGINKAIRRAKWSGEK